MMRAAGDRADGARLRALIVILWRAGLRIGEALDLAETDSTRRAARSWCATERVAGVARSGWIAGRGLNWSRGLPSGVSCQSARCCA